MSVKGIDAQVMLHRVTEYSKDASVQMRKNDSFQDFLTMKNIVDSENSRNQVISTYKTEGSRVDKDKKNRDSQGKEEEVFIIEEIFEETEDTVKETPMALRDPGSSIDVEV